jgi:uncharacterized coiled-coil DUF342 family protein
MSENASIDELLDERREIEAALGDIKNRRKAGELNVLQRRLSPRDEFSALKQLSIKSHQEGEPLRVRLAEINAEVAELRGGQKQGRALAEIIALLKEIRDAVCDTARLSP